MTFFAEDAVNAGILQYARLTYQSRQDLTRAALCMPIDRALSSRDLRQPCHIGRLRPLEVGSERSLRAYRCLRCANTVARSSSSAPGYSQQAPLLLPLSYMSNVRTVKVSGFRVQHLFRFPDWLILNILALHNHVALQHTRLISACHTGGTHLAELRISLNVLLPALNSATSVWMSAHRSCYDSEFY